MYGISQQTLMSALWIDRLDLQGASADGETAEETTFQKCRSCGERFAVSAKRD